MKITSNYPGGNIKVHEIAQDIVYLEQEMRGSPWWFYWNFCVEGAEGKTITFVFENGDVVSTYGPTCSDNAYNWSWCSPDCFISHTSFRYHFSDSETKKYFAFSIPYQVAHFEAFYKRISSDPFVRHCALATSENGRNIPLLVLGHGKENIIFTCRHHCCESTASYVLESIMETLLTSKRYLLDQYTFHVVPFVDIDGVEKGDQGKDRAPHDHNRDYIEKPIYNFTKAFYSYIDKLSIKVFLDFHSPWSWGKYDDLPHIHLGPDIPGNKQDEFTKNLTEITHICPSDDTLLYDDSIRPSRYGQIDCNQTGTTSAKNYFAFHKNPEISSTIETPYFGNLQKPYSIKSLYVWGQNIINALEKTIKQS